MKLLIEKVPNGVKVELATDTSAKPFSKVIRDTEIKSVISLLETAMRTKVFKFYLDL